MRRGLEGRENEHCLHGTSSGFVLLTIVERHFLRALWVDLFLVCASPAFAGPPPVVIDPKAIAGDGVAIGSAITKQVPICKVLHAVRSSTCGVQVLAEKLLPKIFPFSLKKFPVTAEKLASLRKLNADFALETDTYTPPQTYDLDITIPSVRIGTESAPNADTVAMSGKAELYVAPTSSKIKAVKAAVDFSGWVVINIAPRPDVCGTPADDVTVAKIYVTPVIGKITITNLETIRPTWTQLALGDKSVRWLLNSLLSMAPALSLGVDAYSGLRRQSKEGTFQPGFVVCLGSKTDCKAKTKPAKATPPAIVEINAGELGRLDLTTGLPQTPAIADGSNPFICNAIQLATSRNECKASLVNRLAKDLLPLSFPFPREVLRATSQGRDQSTNVTAEIQSIDVSKFDVEGTTLKLQTSARVAVKNAASSTDTPINASATGTLTVTPTCANGSVKLSLAGTKFASFDTGNETVPRWLQEGFGRAVVNSVLPSIDLCLSPIRIPGLSKDLSLCSLTDKLLQQKNTGRIASVFAKNVLPLSFEPWKLMPANSRDPILDLFLKGLSVSISNARVATGVGADTVTADVVANKNGEAAEFKGIGVSVRATSFCGKSNILRLTPTVDTISKGAIKIPKWVVQNALVRVTNNAFALQPPVICLQGACMTQPLNTMPPTQTSSTGFVIATECAVEAKK